MPFAEASLNSGFFYLFFQPCSYARPSKPISVEVLPLNPGPFSLLMTAGWLDLNGIRSLPYVQWL